MTFVGFQEGLSSIRARIAATLIASAVAMYHWHESLEGISRLEKWAKGDSNVAALVGRVERVRVLRSSGRGQEGNSYLAEISGEHGVVLEIILQSEDMKRHELNRTRGGAIKESGARQWQ